MDGTKNTWAYMATPEGASLAHTLGLARGINRDGKTYNYGFIHRRLYRREGEETPNLRDMKSGDDVVLMYDLFNAGLVYPVARFTLARPGQNVTRSDGLKFPVSPVTGCILGHLDPGLARDLFDPDYEGTRDRYCGDKHLALVIKQEEANEVRLPPPEFLGQVFLRKSSNTIERWESLPSFGDWVDEEEGRNKQLCALATESCPHSAGAFVPEIWNKLDGASKQLLVTFDEIDKIRPARHTPVTQPTLAAYVLCALAEYELSKYISAAVRVSVNPRVPRRGLTQNSVKPQMERIRKLPKLGQSDVKCFLVPEVPTGNWNMSHLLWAAHHLHGGKPEVQIIQSILSIRNRIAHSYLITSEHLESLHRSVLRREGLLAALYLTC